MREHNGPRNFENERNELWNGPPIMTEADKPISFIARGVMCPRIPPNASRSDEETEEAECGPRGLPEPRYKAPPERLYRYRGPCELVHPSQVHVFDGKEWYYDPDKDTWYPYFKMAGALRPPLPKWNMAEPTPGLTKHVRGRHAPEAGTTSDRRRKWVCSVETCKKAYLKRYHLNRHVKTVHQHGPAHFCERPHCNYTSTREDNSKTHRRKHTHYQEIFFCSPENDYKGIHLLNPQVVYPMSADIKPYKAISIPPISLNLWRIQESRIRAGEPVKPVATDDVHRYFLDHPDEKEEAYSRHPRWEFRIPTPGPEFTPINGHCMTGQFKLDVVAEKRA